MADYRRPHCLTSDEKNLLAQFLMQNTINGSPRRGVQQEAAEKFAISTRTVRTIWTAVKEQQQKGNPVHFLPNKKKQHMDKWQLDVNKVKSLSILERSSIRTMAYKLGVSKSKLHEWIKDKQLRPHTNAIKPTLTDQNKVARLRWSLSQLQPEVQGETISFESMHNVVHIDEKWFQITKTSDKYYLLPDGDEPYRSCQSKRFIEKVMFICAASRPIIAENGEVIFDGKFGIFPFTTQEPARRNSKNRLKGTMETKPIQAVTRSIMKDAFINQVIPTIIAKWPTGFNKDILIQQDNAKPHIVATDPDFIAAANRDGFRIQLVCQPANSPDTNVNDLGFLRAIQTLQHEKASKGVDDLLKNVTDAFDRILPLKLNSVFLTLQGCYKEIMKVKGCNNYKIPHIDKEALARRGTLPNCIEVEKDLVTDCLNYLKDYENGAGSSYDLGPLQRALGQ